MATWKTRITYGDTVLSNDVTNEVAFTKILTTNNKLMNGNIKVEYYKASRLPEGYTELEYIQSDGNCYINSGYVGRVHAIADVMYLSLSSGGEAQIFGCEGASSQTDARQKLGIYNNNFVMYVGVGATTSTTKAADINVKHTIDCSFFNPASATIDGASQTLWNSSPSYTASTLANYIFAANSSNNAAQYSTIRLYNLQWYSSAGTTNLVRNYIPAKRDSDSALGLYDLVNNNFLTNSGSGSFTAGPEVE